MKKLFIITIALVTLTFTTDSIAANKSDTATSDNTESSGVFSYISHKWGAFVETLVNMLKEIVPDSIQDSVPDTIDLLHN